MDTLKDKKLIDDGYKIGFHDDLKYSFKLKKGIDVDIVKAISKHKHEPKWMEDFRLRSYKIFTEKKMPEWIADEKDLKDIKFDEIFYYLDPTNKTEKKWGDVPDQIK